MNFSKSIDTPVIKNLIIINILIWLISITGINVFHINITQWTGLHFFAGSKFNIAQLFSYMFMHDTRSISHIFFNMFSLYMFGSTLEQYWGSKRFLLFYIVCGLGAGIVQELAWLFDFREIYFNDMINNIDIGETIVSKADFYNIPLTVGASGCIFGLLLAFGMLFPDVPIMLLFIPIPIRARIFVIIYAVAEFFLGVTNFSGDNIAHFAHLGGMIFGYILIKYWQKKQFNNY